MRYRFVEAESEADAIEQVTYPDGRGEGSSLEGDRARVEILIVPAKAVTTVNLESYRVEEKQRKRKDDQKEAEERAELERLKAKYEGS